MGVYPLKGDFFKCILNEIQLMGLSDLLILILMKFIYRHMGLRAKTTAGWLSVSVHITCRLFLDDTQKHEQRQQS